MVNVLVLLAIAVGMGVGLWWFLSRKPGAMSVKPDEGEEIQPPEE